MLLADFIEYVEDLICQFSSRGDYQGSQAI